MYIERILIYKINDIVSLHSINMRWVCLCPTQNKKDKGKLLFLKKSLFKNPKWIKRSSIPANSSYSHYRTAMSKNVMQRCNIVMHRIEPDRDASIIFAGMMWKDETWFLRNEMYNRQKCGEKCYTFCWCSTSNAVFETCLLQNLR